MFIIIFSELVKLLSAVKSNDLPLTNALIILTGLQSFNLLSIVMILLNESSQLMNKDGNAILGGLTFLGLTLINYFRYYLPYKRNSLISGHQKGVKRALFFWSYLIITLASTFYITSHYYLINSRL
jgi:hypothetical protein